MMKTTTMSLKALTFSAALCASLGLSLSSNAETIEVQKLKHAGPYPVATPWMADSVNVKGEKFSMEGVLDSPLSFTLLNNGKEVAASRLLADSKQNAIHLASFTVSNSSRTKATIEVKGLKQYRLFVDGEQVTVNGGKAETTLRPSSHTVVIKYLTESSDKDFKISITAADGKQLSVGESAASTKRAFSIYDVICMPNYASVQMSPNGKFMIVRKTWVDRQGKNHSINELRNSQTNKVVASFEESVRWMPRTNKMYFTQKASDSSIAGEGKADGELQLITINPLNMDREVLASNIPDGWFQFTPDEKTLIYTLYTEGRKKDAQVYDVKEPDDRQPGWRSRSYLARFDLASGVLQPLTFGYHNVYLSDISADSRYLLIGKSEERLTKRPTTLNSYYRLNLNDMSVETLIEKGEFLNGAQFSPDGKSILVTGSPEAFNGIGKNVEEGQIPSMIDTQLYLMTLADKKVRPLTKDFNPNVQSVDWSKADGNIYFTAEDKDCMHLFQLNPKSGKFTLLKTPEENIKSFSVASSATEMAFSGQSASNADRLYKMNLKAQKSQLVDDLSARLLKNIELGECKAWNFVNSRGDTLCCRYYLPPH
uniref:TolB family protein n=1 Tax=Prevotella sp. TaxID=59823 RepID=UPI004029B415